LALSVNRERLLRAEPVVRGGSAFFVRHHASAHFPLDTLFAVSLSRDWHFGCITFGICLCDQLRDFLHLDFLHPPHGAASMGAISMFSGWSFFVFVDCAKIWSH
jgi:hypothetical protein